LFLLIKSMCDNRIAIIKYNTLLKYANREFGASVKVARKSHVKKDLEAVSSFKKTSLKSVENPAWKQKKSTKK
ncbi:MAG: hypothetical protein ACKO96_14945, partial [Flammeovirgaceae bacterium]